MLRNPNKQNNEIVLLYFRESLTLTSCKTISPRRQRLRNKYVKAHENSTFPLLLIRHLQPTALLVTNKINCIIYIKK